MHTPTHLTEPWRLNDDFTGTHQIHVSSVAPDSEPVALLGMEDYSRSIACVNALAGIDEPAAFMAAVRELRTAPDQAAVFAIHRKILAMLPKETADGQ